MIPAPVQRLLRVAGWCFYGLFLVNLIGLSLPVRLLAPQWQLLAIGNLLSTAPFALLGTCCLVLGSSHHPSEESLLQGRSRLIARLASLGFVLIIPLQMSASWRVAGLAEVPSNRLIATLRAAKREVQTSRTRAELNTALSKLPGAPRVPEQVAIPLATIQTSAVSRLRQDLDLQLAQQRQRLSERRSADATTILRSAITALLYALFFTTAANGTLPLPDRQALRAWNPLIRLRLLLEEWSRRRQVATSLRLGRRRTQDQASRLRLLLTRFEAFRLQRRSLERARQFERLRRQAEKEAARSADHRG